MVDIRRRTRMRVMAEQMRAEALSKDSKDCTDTHYLNTEEGAAKEEHEDLSRRRRNDLRARLATDSTYAHQWLCHEGQECEDGCDRVAQGHGADGAEPSRVEFYLSAFEEPAHA